MVAKFVHENLTWKKILMSWMVLLVASKMVLLMLRMECTEILHEAEELWQRQGSTATSQCGSGSDASSECGASVASGSTGASNVDFNEHYIHASRIIQAARA